MVGIAGTSAYYWFITGCCCNPYTTVTNVWTCYVRMASRSYWINDDEGGVRGSIARLCHSSQHGEYPIWLVKASFARVVTLLLGFKSSSIKLPYMAC